MPNAETPSVLRARISLQGEPEHRMEIAAFVFLLVYFLTQERRF
jgi:hypothetical protein